MQSFVRIFTPRIWRTGDYQDFSVRNFGNFTAPFIVSLGIVTITTYVQTVQQHVSCINFSGHV